MSTPRDAVRASLPLLWIALLLSIPASSEDAPVVESYQVREEMAKSATEKASAIVGTGSVELVEGRLIVTASPAQQDRVAATLRALGARVTQYDVRLLTGVSNAEAQRLLEDKRAVVFSARSSRASRREASIRVSDGVPALIENGEILEVIEAAYVDLYGGGYRTRDVSLVHSYRVRVDARGDRAEVEIEYSGARSSGTHRADREVSIASTVLEVDLGKWTRVSGKAADEDRARKSYGTKSPRASSSLLLRVDLVP